MKLNKSNRKILNSLIKLAKVEKDILRKHMSTQKKLSAPFWPSNR